MTYCRGEWDCHGPTGMGRWGQEGYILKGGKVRICVSVCFVSFLELHQIWMMLSSVKQGEIVEMIKTAARKKIDDQK